MYKAIWAQLMAGEILTMSKKISICLMQFTAGTLVGCVMGQNFGKELFTLALGVFLFCSRIIMMSCQSQYMVAPILEYGNIFFIRRCCKVDAEMSSNSITSDERRNLFCSGRILLKVEIVCLISCRSSILNSLRSSEVRIFAGMILNIYLLQSSAE